LDQRRQIAEDLAFSDPSNPEQWDETIKCQRETDPGGVRPCYVFDQCGQYVANVAGQVEQNPPALHALPVGNGADKRVAEKLDGFFRHIEHTSRLQQHTARVLTSAARAGVGYYIVRPDYVNRALNWQEPRIFSEGDPLKVVLDPWSVELDGCDATFGFLLSPISPREFERKYGKKAEQRSFGDDGTTKRDPRESIITAEMWKIETARKRMIVVFDGDQVNPSSTMSSGVEIRFTAAASTADDDIVFTVAVATGPVLVVTDDRELRERVTSEGANVVGGRAFLGALDR
jgi:hypothetical protein